MKHVEEQLASCVEVMKAMVASQKEKQWKEDIKDENKALWRDVAIYVDKCCFFFFGIALISGTVLLLVIIPSS